MYFSKTSTTGVRPRILIVVFLTLLLNGCLPETRTSELVPVIKASTQTNEPVLVLTRNTPDQSTLEAPGDPSADLERGLKESLVQSGLFREIGPGGYQLETMVLDFSQPAAVFDTITQVTVAYNLTRSGTSVWRKTLRTSHLTETEEGSLGEFRDRLSAEGAIRENIKLAVSAMSEALR